MRKLLVAILLFAQPVMAADLGVLHESVKEICPIVGLSGDADDPANLRIDYADGATSQQRKAAKEFLASLTKDSPEIQPPDVEGFFVECLSSSVFTTDELVQILYCERQKNQAKRDALILKLVMKAPPERQMKLVEIAGKHSIRLPKN